MFHLLDGYHEVLRNIVCDTEKTLKKGEAILIFGRRQWHPTPVLLPGKSHGRRSLVGYSPWGP